MTDPQNETTDAVVLDMDEMANSLDGWDEIAVKKMFKDSLSNIGQQDAMAFMRVLYFVHLRRQDQTPGKSQGKKDEDAYNEAMGMSLKALGETFGSAPDLDPSAEADRDREWAEFVIGTGMNLTVHEFMTLTLNQRAEAIKAANKRG